MAKKRGKTKQEPVRINKLTNFFWGIVIGLVIGFKGGTLNLIIGIIFVVIAIITAFIYKNQR